MLFCFNRCFLIKKQMTFAITIVFYFLVKFYAGTNRIFFIIKWKMLLARTKVLPILLLVFCHIGRNLPECFLIGIKFIPEFVGDSLKKFYG